MKKSPRTMKRRRFVTLLALGGGALVSAPLSRAASALTRAGTREPARRRAPSAAVKREIETQEKSLAEQLKTLRAYELPPGSPMAFSFRALKAKRGVRR
jgi:hypothetical protein